MSKQNVWFITGTSTGLGRALAEAVIARGDKVFATVRKPGTNQDLVKMAPDRVSIFELDVTQSEHIQKAVAKAKEVFGRIDVLVNNAGYGLMGNVEEDTEDQIRRQIETNLVGSILTARAVLPVMREQQSGHIFQISSVGGQVAFPGLSIYHATKWGIEGFSESLAAEVAALNIQVTIVEPGGIRTDWSGRSMDFGTPLDAYKPTALGQMRQMYQNMGPEGIIGDPVKMAQAIVNVASQPSAPLRLVLGSDAYQALTGTIQGRLTSLQGQETSAKSTDVSGLAASSQRN